MAKARRAILFSNVYVNNDIHRNKYNVNTSLYITKIKYDAILSVYKHCHIEKHRTSVINIPTWESNKATTQCLKLHIVL